MARAGTVALVLLALSSPAARAFRLRNESESEPGVDLSYGEAAAEVDKLPDPTTYSSWWKERYALEKRLDEPMAPSVQLILGVFSTAGEAEYRKVVRSTWLQQKGVCYWSNLPRVGCSVYVAFVMGTPEEQTPEIRKLMAEALQEPGVLVMPDMAENMNEGKSPLWMALAAERFPWATHYAKMDMDTYPFLHKLVARMDANRSCVRESSEFEYIGRPGNWGIKAWAFNQGCAYKPCMGWFNTPKLDALGMHEPFRFMEGQLYILSRPLVKAITWHKKRGNEDVVMADFVRQFSMRTGKCVALRKLNAHVHLGRYVNWAVVNAPGVVDEAFANDF